MIRNIFFRIFAVFGAMLENAYADNLRESIASSPTVLPLLVAFSLITYFMIIRPQNKSDSEHRRLIATIKVGDKIKLTCGIIGTISEFDEENIVLKVSESSTITVDKNALCNILPNNDTN
jgi:preprotein translocase subunit YajC